VYAAGRVAPPGAAVGASGAPAIAAVPAGAGVIRGSPSVGTSAVPQLAVVAVAPAPTPPGTGRRQVSAPVLLKPTQQLQQQPQQLPHAPQERRLSVPAAQAGYPRAVSVATAAQSSVGSHAKAVAVLLEDREKLKTVVIDCFWEASKGEEQMGLQELYAFRSAFARASKLPESLLSGMSADYVRFDFDGNGRLSLNEIYKLVKFHLYNFHRSSGARLSEADVPKSTLAEAGYTITKEVGRGAYGIVYFATSKKGEERCIKSYRKEALSAFGLRELKDEFEAMQLLACERIAQAFEVFQDGDRLYMIGEAYHGGDFQTLKERALQQGISLTEHWWRGVFRQCFEGLLFMHGQAMMHCDLKEPNVMLRTADFRAPKVVIIDLGLAKAMVGEYGVGGTPGYMPPETLQRKMWFPKGDVFSMGVTMMQVICDKIPPTGARTVRTPGGIFVEGCRTLEDIANATRTRQPPFHLVPKEMPLLTAFLARLLNKQMPERPSAYQSLKDPWFSARLGTEGSDLCARTFTLTSVSMQEVVGSRNRFCTDGITGFDAPMVVSA